MSDNPNSTVSDALNTSAASRPVGDDTFGGDTRDRTANTEPAGKIEADAAGASAGSFGRNTMDAGTTADTTPGAGFGTVATADTAPTVRLPGSPAQAGGNGNSGSAPNNGQNQGSTPVMEQAHQAVQQAQEAAGRVVDQAQEAAARVVDQARDQLRNQIHDQKGRIAGGLGDIASAFRQTGDQLHQSGQAPVAQYVHGAAQQLEQLSGYLNERNIEDLVWEAENFARRQPAWFLGGAFALGFLASRFFKSSSQSRAMVARSDTDLSPYLSQSRPEGIGSYAGSRDISRSGGSYGQPAYRRQGYEQAAYSRQGYDQQGRTAEGRRGADIGIGEPDGDRVRTGDGA